LLLPDPSSYKLVGIVLDYVVLRTMLLFSRVDFTLHAGGGTRRVGAAYMGWQRQHSYTERWLL